jgi:hypothetical protein
LPEALVPTPPEEAPPAPAPVAPAWVELFSGETLRGWRRHWGTWSVQDGIVAGTGKGEGRGRIESKRHYGAFEMECEIRMSGSPICEFQVGSYAYFCQIDLRGRESGWHRLRAEVRAGRLSATLDGDALLTEIGTGWEAPNTGPIAFYVTRGGSLAIRAGRIREHGE